MLQILFVLMGTFIGAGFASGKEIFNFFSVYSYAGILSIFLCAFLSFLLLWKCFHLKMKWNIQSYIDFLDFLEKKYTFFHKRSFLYIINIFLSASFYTMMIALSSLFYYQLQISKIVTITITVLICYFILYRKNIHFISSFNSVLIPILMIFLCLLFLQHISLKKIFFASLSSAMFGHGIVMGLFYFSYNSLLVIPILFNLNIKGQEKNIVKISFLYAFLLFSMTFLLNLLLLRYYPIIASVDLPILHIVNTSSAIFTFLYFFIFLSAILTTLFSSGYSLVCNFNQHYLKIKIILFLSLSFLFSFFSFSTLINVFYPMFGILGFFQLILLIL